jgi:Fic family protein
LERQPEPPTDSPQRWNYDLHRAATGTLSRPTSKFQAAVLYVALVDPKNFTSTSFGEPARGNWDKWVFWYFAPRSLPRELSLGAETIYALSEADAALGLLEGLGRLIRDPDLLVGPYLTREALASSRIEGTQASLSEVLQAEASGTEKQEDDGVAEVTRYLEATRLGLRLLDTLPITERLIKQVHEVLMTGVRGENKLPGQFRQTPVWVGSPTDSPETATYVPPLPGEIPALFTDWERFVNLPTRLPLLVRCALMHYQFETIHPFFDGNGRIGRLLIVLMLIEEKRLSAPLLYISGYLETRRREYYDRLEAVRETGAIEAYLQFFFTAVTKAADDAVQRSAQLIELRERYITEAAGARSRVGSIVDLIFTNPFLTVGRVERALGLTNQGARNLILNAEQRGWLTNIATRGRGGRHYWVAEQIFEIIDAPVSYLEDHGIHDSDAGSPASSDDA